MKGAEIGQKIVENFVKNLLKTKNYTFIYILYILFIVEKNTTITKMLKKMVSFYNQLKKRWQKGARYERMRIK